MQFSKNTRQLLNFFNLSPDSSERQSFLSLMDSHSKFDQALDLAGQKLVAHVGLVSEDLVT